VTVLAEVKCKLYWADWVVPTGCFACRNAVSELWDVPDTARTAWFVFHDQRVAGSTKVHYDLGPAMMVGRKHIGSIYGALKRLLLKIGPTVYVEVYYSTEEAAAWTPGAGKDMDSKDGSRPD
jgi:hypothetical protein